jgi:thiamine-phosphate pyrophosphorylase
MPRRIEGIYGILPADLPLDDLLAKAEAALAGGVRILQLRDKKQEADRLAERARALRELTRASGALLIINDFLHTAIRAKADGVHFGPTDCPNLTQLRCETGPDLIVGVSCKADAAFARHVLSSGADYVSFGSIFPTASKSGANVIGLARLMKARQIFPEANIVAIGGIHARNLREVKRAGADAAALISDLFSAEDIEKKAKTLVRIWEEG